MTGRHEIEVPSVTKAIVVLGVLAAFAWLCIYSLTYKPPRNHHPEPVGYIQSDIDAVNRLAAASLETAARPVRLWGRGGPRENVRKMLYPHAEE